MPALLFKLRNVPNDEADEIRALLNEQRVEYYETSAGNWGVSMPAIWVQEELDLNRGKALIDQYQKDRSEQMRKHYERRKAQGIEPGLWTALCQRPFISLLVFAFCAFILYVMISPVVQMVQFSRQ